MSDLSQFIRDQIANAEKTLKARLEMQRTWSEGTDESWRAVGCTDSKEQRMKRAEIHGRIALRNKAELESFRHLATALACLKLIESEGVQRGNNWCAEQARRTLEECG